MRPDTVHFPFSLANTGGLSPRMNGGNVGLIPEDLSNAQEFNLLYLS